MHAHPKDESIIVKAAGYTLVLWDINDPHSQRFLRGHDMPITAIDISPCGSTIASGQEGSVHVKGFPAPVLVWSYETLDCILVLKGVTQGVTRLHFSPDGRFLCGAGLDGLLYIWDAATGEVAYGKRYGKQVQLFQWGSIDTTGRRPVYNCSLCWTTDVMAMKLAFDPIRRQWHLSGDAMLIPSSGLNRDYHTSLIYQDYLLCGSNIGDMVVFRLGSWVYRASVPVCGGGLLSLCADEGSESVFCGAGDGSVKKIVGNEMTWTMAAEVTLDGPVLSLSSRADGVELFAATKAGSTYRILMDDLTATKISSAHTSAITAVATGPRADVFATADEDGFIKVCQIVESPSRTLPHNHSKPPLRLPVENRPVQGASKGVGATCLCWIGDQAVVSGWKDGSIHCLDTGTGEELWSIANAHRGPLTSVAVHAGSTLAYLLSGAVLTLLCSSRLAAEDGSVRVWSLRSREMLLQFVEHQKGVTQVLVDVGSPSLVPRALPVHQQPALSPSHSLCPCTFDSRLVMQEISLCFSQPQRAVPSSLWRRHSGTYTRTCRSTAPHPRKHIIFTCLEVSRQGTSFLSSYLGLLGCY
ncbi:unnamed protein product [Chrysoparadoxa australica]